jgi:putative spermidine/putrescine transport system permease protein
MSMTLAPGSRRPAFRGTVLRRILTAVYLIVTIGFLLAPLAVVTLSSVTTTSYLAVPPVGFSLRWFEAVLTSSSYLNAISTSLLLALTSTLGSTILGTAAAYGIARYEFPGRVALAALFNAPLIVPGAVIGVAVLQYLSLTGMRGGYGPLIALHMICTIPYVIRSVLTSLANSDPLVEQAARTLGASSFAAFFLVTLPMITPGVMSGAIFSFITSMGEVSATLFVLTVRQTTLPVKIFSMVEFGVDPSIAAACTMMIAVTIVLIAIAARFTRFHHHM